MNVHIACLCLLFAFVGHALSETSKCGQSYELLQPGLKPTSSVFAVEGEIPWNVALMNKKGSDHWSRVCSASFLNHEWLLTAAHCVKNVELKNIKGITVTHKAQLYFDRKIMHERFRKVKTGGLFNDIALLHLNKSFTLSESTGIGSLCIPPKGKPGNLQNVMYITETKKQQAEDGHIFERVKIAPIYRVNDSYCQHIYRANFRKGIMFCAGNAEHNDYGCGADTGATSYRKIKDSFFAEGIASFDADCQINSFTSVYTNVTHFASWITKHTNITSFEV